MVVIGRGKKKYDNNTVVNFLRVVTVVATPGRKVRREKEKEVRGK